jgi:hypothetical protein
VTAPRPDTVVIEGMLEGPASSWEPEAGALAEALRRAGAPEIALHVVVEGGRCAVESVDRPLPREQFAAEPAEALSIALQNLFEGHARGRPAEWFSTLRVTEYTATTKKETLLAFGAEGIERPTRESPWTPPAEGAALSGGLRARAPIILLVLVALAAVALLRRDAISAWLQEVVAIFSPGRAADVRVDAGTFHPWITPTLKRDGTTWKLTLKPKSDFPADAAAIDRWTRDATLEQRAALRALESGRVRVVLVGSDERRDPHSISADVTPLRRGEKTVLDLPSREWVGRLTAVRLEP